jgi:hypothetical protein
VVDAYSIWLHARSAVTGAQYPRRVAYTIAVSGLAGQSPAVDHYRANCDPQAGSVKVFPISDEELAKPPPVPHGINFAATIGLCAGQGGGCTGISIPVGHPPPTEDLLGEPLLTPTYMFGLRYRQPSGTPAGGESALPVIAIVSAQAPDYQISLVDTPTIGDTLTYHLRLSPLRRPKDNRLRQLWVGAGDYLPRRAIVSGNFTIAPLVDVPWTVEFSTIGGVPYITSETATGTLYLAHRRAVREATIAFEDIREPDGTIFDTPLVTPDSTETTLVEPDK